MIWVTIGGHRAELGSLSERTIQSEINRLEKHGAVCVVVAIQQNSVNLSFATRGCHPRGVSRDHYSRQELGVIEVWQKLGLDEPDWTSADLVAFLKQIRKL